MSTTRSYIRRTRQQWKELIELQPGSELSPPKFCEQAGVSYQSFMAWRKKLKMPDTQSTHPPQFVELTAPVNTPVDSESMGVVSEWQVELDLGNGIQLRIAQH